MKTCPVMLLLVILFFPVTGIAESGDILERFSAGCINWTQGFLESQGTAAPDAVKGETSAGDQNILLNVSRNHALKNMLSVMLKTDIRADLSVGDVAEKNEIMMAQIETLAKSAKVVRQEYLSDGTVEISLRMDLYGGFSQLVLPEEIKQIEPIKTVSSAASPDPETDAAEGANQEIFTGLVVDARGTKIKPCMAPLIVDENGKEVYGAMFVSREFAVQKGMSKYVRDIKAAQADNSVATHPLTVKGLKADPRIPSKIIISNADASKIRSASEHLSFLKKCQVVIVMD